MKCDDRRFIHISYSFPIARNVFFVQCVGLHVAGIYTVIVMPTIGGAGSPQEILKNYTL